MTLTGLNADRKRYLNLTKTERITLIEVAKYEAGAMPPHYQELLNAVREWTDISKGSLSDYGTSPLIERGLIEAHKDGNARRYTLTEEGQKVLAGGQELIEERLEGLPDE